MRGNIRRLTADATRRSVFDPPLLQRNTFAPSDQWRALLKLAKLKPGGRDVDLALQLDVLAVCAVFAFVTAILLGAF